VRPFIVVTKRAHPDVHITEEEIKAKFNWMPSDNIWYLENYTALQQAYRSDTEKTVLMMLHNLLLRQSAQYSQNQSMFLNNMRNMSAVSEPMIRDNDNSHEINVSDFHMIDPSPEEEEEMNNFAREKSTINNSNNKNYNNLTRHNVETTNNGPSNDTTSLTKSSTNPFNRTPSPAELVASSSSSNTKTNNLSTSNSMETN
jgi:hypothetical protein